MSFLPSTFFSGTGGDDLLTQDVHAIEQNNGTINSVYNAAKEALGDITQSIRDRPGSLVDLSRIVSGGSSYYSKADVLSRVANVLGAGTSTGLGKLSSTMQDTLFAQLGVNKETATTLKAKLGDATRVFQYGDVTDARNQFELLSVFAGDSTFAKIFDLEAEAAWASALIRGAIDMGVPDILSTIQFNASDPYVYTSSMYASADYIFQSADLVMIDQLILDLKSETVQGASPNGPQYLLSNYRFDAGTTPDQYPDLLAKLLATLISYSPNWATVPRAGERITSLKPFAGISADAKTLLQLSDEHRVWATFGDSFAFTSSISDIAQQFYPEASITAVADARLSEIAGADSALYSQQEVAKQIDKYLSS